MGLHQQSPEKSLVVAQGQPAALVGRQPQGFVALHSRKPAAIHGPLPDGQQGWFTPIRLMGDINRQGTNLGTISELAELMAQQAEKPL
jgi:hypothetical protein